MDWTLEHWIEICAGYFALQQLGKIIVKLTPSTKDDDIFAKITGFIESIIILRKTGK
jgi:hypothetical protein